jgi:DNA (cytosine-5)-methyltransferase 1
MIKVGTDFSGVGSPETALKRLGIEHEVEFACDIDKYARTSYQALHNPKQLFEDITTRPVEFPQLDLYVAGFPCQSFSIAGLRKGFECPTNGTLFYTLSEFIRINQPKCFILENVKGLINHDNGRTFQIIKDKLSGSGGSVNNQMYLTDIDGLGYHVHYKVLNTKDFGLPQHRERIFIVGFKNPRHFSFPVGQSLKIRLKDILEKNPDSKYILSDKMIERLTRLQKEKYSFAKQFTDVNKKDISHCLTASYPGGTDCEFIIHSTHTRSANRPSVQKNKNAGGSGHLSKSDGTTYCLDTQNSQAIEVRQMNQSTESNGQQPYQQNRIYDIDGISPALLSQLPQGSNIINTKVIRRLTPLECFRLQGFTDEEHSICKEIQSDRQLYKQMGNTISVPVIQAILKKIYHA